MVPRYNSAFSCFFAINGSRSPWSPFTRRDASSRQVDVSDTYIFSHKRVSEIRKTSSSSMDSVFSIILREIDRFYLRRAMYMLSASLCKLFNNEKTTLRSGVIYKSMSSINHKRCKQNFIFYKCLNASSQNSRSLLSRIKELIARGSCIFHNVCVM